MNDIFGKFERLIMQVKLFVLAIIACLSIPAYISKISIEDVNENITLSEAKEKAEEFLSTWLEGKRFSYVRHFDGGQGEIYISYYLNEGLYPHNFFFVLVDITAEDILYCSKSENNEYVSVQYEKKDGVSSLMSDPK